MSEQVNLLAQVRQYLISRNEDYEWITMGANSERIGLAYLPVDDTAVPCTFMFTELREPSSLVFDVHFAARVPQEDIQELSLLLLTINANLPVGQLLLDMEGGFIYFRHKYVPSPNDTEQEIQKHIADMEQIGASICLTYARVIAQEFGLI